MRFLITLLTTAALFCAVASTATAIEFSIIGADFATPLPGETFTIDIVMTNTSATPVNGLGASVTGIDKIEFVSGQAVGSYLNAICVAPGTCFGGLTNLAAPNLVESAIGANGNRVQIALSAALTPSTGAPGTDQGLDNVVGSTQFRLTFVATPGSGVSYINIGTSYQGDGVILPDGSTIQAQSATFVLNVMPEPGTALLIGLGLAGLSATGRRDQSPS